MQLRMSPGGSIPHSWRRRPELPPSSVTATTAVMFRVKPLSPPNSVERPVPPPMATMRGPIESLYSIAFVIMLLLECFARRSRSRLEEAK